MRSARRIGLVSHDARSVARGCRAAGLAFLEGAREGWSRRDLDRWLAGAYSDVSVRIDDEEAQTPDRLGPRAVAELIELVGVAITEALRDLVVDPAPLLDVVVHAGAIVSLQRDDGGLWMPVDRPSFDIETRVLSLFATDYLLDPDAYESDLAVCACDRVSFDAIGRCSDCEPPHSEVRRISESSPMLDLAAG
jgi:hypothetical protein